MFGVFHVGSFVPGASERVNIVYAWLQQVLQERLKDNGLTLAAPVGSRMWQILSEGYAQFEQCRWLSTCPLIVSSFYHCQSEIIPCPNRHVCVIRSQSLLQAHALLWLFWGSLGIK